MKSLGFIRRNLLNELLSLPHLIEQIQALPAPRFHEIILQAGLEDCGELVSMATASQLEELFDVDLWRNVAPGETEFFDSDRFMLWLEILLEAGEDVAVEKICHMDTELLLYAMAKHLLVLSTLELERLFRLEDDDAHQVDALLESCLYEELFEFQVISRNPESWDTLLTVLVALDKNHHHMLWSILEQLAQRGSNQVADESLYTVLSDIESMAENMRDKRDTRRGEKGYVSSLDARAFLGLAYKHTIDELLSSQTRDAITTAYFRTYSPRKSDVTNWDSPHSVSAILNIVRKHIPDAGTTSVAGFLPGDIADNQTILQQILQHLSEEAPSLYRTRVSELSYLGNVVAAGCSLNGDRMRNVDASRAVFATCALGIDVALRRTSASWSHDKVIAIIKQIPMERLFLAGWKSLPHGASRARDFPYVRRNEQTGVCVFFDSMLTAQ